MSLKNYFAEIAEYFNLDIEDLMKRHLEVSQKYDGYSKWAKVTEKEFDELKLDTKDSVQLKEFYTNTDNYIYELMEYHSTDVKAKMRQHCIEIMKKHKTTNVLDFGCGIGEDSIEAAMVGIKAIA